MGEVVGKWEGEDRERRQTAQLVLLAKPGISPGHSWFGESAAGLCKLKGRELAPDTSDAPTHALYPDTGHNTKQPCKSKHKSAHLQNLGGQYH